MHPILSTQNCALVASFLLALGQGEQTQERPVRTTGTVLLLRNDAVLEGEIAKIGDQYRVRRGAGETMIPADRAKLLCADWQEALAWLRAEAKLSDPDERLRLARWCQQNHLPAEAVAEAEAALKVRPDHPETKALLLLARRAVEQSSQKTPATPAAVPKMMAPPPQLDLSADAVAAFTTRVQPILMNLCASCHAAAEYTGPFHLVRATDGGQRSATQRNLAAALQHLNLDRPAASVLLAKAVSAHGTASTPPLRDRRAVAFQNLQYWVEQLVANNPHLRGSREPRLAQTEVPEPPPPQAAFVPAPTRPTNKPAPVVSKSIGRVDPGPPAAPPAAANPTVSYDTLAPLPPVASAPAPLATPATNTAPPPATPSAVVDPFDPELFNRAASKR